MDAESELTEESLAQATLDAELYAIQLNPGNNTPKEVSEEKSEVPVPEKLAVNLAPAPEELSMEIEENAPDGLREKGAFAPEKKILEKEAEAPENDLTMENSTIFVESSHFSNCSSWPFQGELLQLYRQATVFK